MAQHQLACFIVLEVTVRYSWIAIAISSVADQVYVRSFNTLLDPASSNLELTCLIIVL